MRRLFHAALVVLAALRAAGCADDARGPLLRSIHGPWRWIRSTGGITDIRLDPAAEGFNATFYFERDGTLDIYRDDRRQDRIALAMLRHPAPDATAVLLLRYAHPLAIFPFDPGVERQTARLVAEDTLVLIDPCCNRYTHTLVRIE